MTVEVKSMKAELKIDYLSINFPENTFTPISLKNAIAPEDMIFNPVGKHGEESSFWTSPFGVQFRKNNGFQNMQTVYFSGNGMKHFESSALALYKKYGTSIARLDFAFDIDMTIADWREFIKSVFCDSMDSDRKNKKYNLITGTEKDACTVYIGSRRSPYFFRIYNKTLEQREKAENGVYKIRYECEMKRFTRIRRGEKQEYNPHVWYENYYNDDWSWVSEYKKLLSSYIPECALPCSIEELELIKPQNFLFCCVQSESISSAKAVSVQSVYTESSDFNRTLNYLTDRFGKYIPFIIMNTGMMNYCLQKANEFTGFKYIFEGSVFVDDSEYLSPFELIDKEDEWEQTSI